MRVLFKKFDNEFFERKQKILLFLSNSFFLKWVLGLHKLPKPLKSLEISRIYPSSIHWKTGKLLKKKLCRKGFRTKTIFVEEWQAACFTRPRFAEALSFYLCPFWLLCHLFDTLIANNFVPSLNLGFDVIDYYCGNGDGYVYKFDSSDWDTVHDASSGVASYTATYYYVGSTRLGGPTTYYKGIFRGFWPVDTSGIPDGASITEAILYLNCYSVVASPTQSVGVVQTSQASVNSLISDDYDQCGLVDDPIEGAARIVHNNIPDDQYTGWTLNETGRGWIDKAGWTKLGTRNGNQDMDDVAVGSDVNIRFCFSNYTGTSRDPYLRVTYQEAAAGRSFGHIF